MCTEAVGKPQGRPAAVRIAVLLAASLAGCSPLPIQPVLPPLLAQAPAWPVTGRQGWLPDSRPLRFGAYVTSARVRQLQTQRTPCTADCQAYALGGVQLALRGQQEAIRHTLQFTQFGPDAAPLSVIALAATWQEEQQWRVEAFGRSLSGSEGERIVQPLIGVLEAPSGSAQVWRFVLSGKPGADHVGWAQTDAGQRIEVRRLAARVVGGTATPVTPLAGMLPAGYTLLSNDQALAAVRLLGDSEGEVWMSPSASAELRQAAAALISVLLLSPGGHSSP